jgi:hypothetical protein
MNQAIKNNVPNAFNTPRLCMLTGDIKPLGQLKPNWKETQLSNQAAKDREALALKNHINAYITIGKKADSDKRHAMKKASI